MGSTLAVCKTKGLPKLRGRLEILPSYFAGKPLGLWLARLMVAGLGLSLRMPGRERPRVAWGGRGKAGTLGGAQQALGHGRARGERLGRNVAGGMRLSSTCLRGVGWQDGQGGVWADPGHPFQGSTSELPQTVVTHLEVSIV